MSTKKLCPSSCDERFFNTASGSEKLNLPKLPGVLAEAQHFASGACTQLKWSLEFYKNRLFGE